MALLRSVLAAVLMVGVVATGCTGASAMAVVPGATATAATSTTTATSAATPTASAAPAEAGPLVLTVTPDSTTVAPGSQMKLVIAIKNVTKDEQKIDVPNLVWWAEADAAEIKIAGWPKMAGRGPVVIFKSVAIAPGGSYEHTWTAGVAETAKAGELTFRVGVALHKKADEKTWAQPTKVTIEAKK